jgi:site-specific recombinase XerD
VIQTFLSISLEKVAEKYVAAKKLSTGTQKEYRSTVTKWLARGQGVDVDQIDRRHIRDYLDWVHDKAANDGGSNAGRLPVPNPLRESSLLAI